MAYESYMAVADQVQARELAATESPFTIEVRFLGGLNSRQKAAFTSAADRWVKAIVGDLPPVRIGDDVIDDILIEAQGRPIDGPGKILGQAGPTHVRPEGTGATALLPAKGIMTFDTDDLKKMQSEGTLNDVITHEMGHVLGIGTIWPLKKLLKGEGTDNPTFSGKAAIAAYKKLRGAGRSVRVPVENTGGPGTAGGHWRETVFRNELMSGFIAAPGNPMSSVTVGSLQDLGYAVDASAAEPFTLPDLLSLAEEGRLVAPRGPFAEGMVLPNIPIVLPRESLV
jgi:Leishmanolysin